MRIYRLITRDGFELAIVQAESVIDAITAPPASRAPLDALILTADGSRVLARRELWTGECLGWSLVPGTR
jgi:hypothetical protein